ncbi:hypothetical protein MAR_038285, partial [Mya arenaria]
NKIPTENLAQRPKTVATKSRRVLLQIKPETCDVGFGTCKPEITIEDVHYSEEKIQFYTGLPNYHTFEALFTTLTNLDNNTLSSGTGRTRKHRPSIVFLPELHVLKKLVPSCFSAFSDTGIVLDCTEIFVQRPSYGGQGFYSFET